MLILSPFAVARRLRLYREVIIRDSAGVPSVHIRGVLMGVDVESISSKLSEGEEVGCREHWSVETIPMPCQHRS